jgi:small-conductance mechanosensitive channel
MTGDESRKLKVGDRVQWDNSLTDRGTISEVDWRGVTIKWDDGRANAIYHNDMAQVDRVPVNLG